MAKKQKKKEPETTPENALPQNLHPMGERTEGNKIIYISQKVYKEIRKFTQVKTGNERGGILAGQVIEEFGKANILIEGFIEAKHSESTASTLTFTHETWDYVHKEMDKKYEGKKIVGWIHTHPDFGIFLSEYDTFIHQNFFSEENQIAYVIDPIQGIEGFYYWVNGSIERCKGYFIYDKTGVKITVGEEPTAEPEEPAEESLFTLGNVLLGALWVAVLFLIFSQISVNRQLDQLEAQQEAILTSANQSLSYLQQQVALQSSEIAQLEAQLAAAQTQETTQEATQETTEETTEETTSETIPETASTEPTTP